MNSIPQHIAINRFVGNVVQTGDDSMMVMWGTMFAAAVAVLAAWLKKRHQGSEN
jgi:hypothetical protein